MLCAFSGPPRILRLHGRGEVLRPGDAGFDALLAKAAFEEPSIPAARRSIVRVEVSRIADSCGYGVPLMAHEAHRPHSTLSAEKRLRAGGPEAISDYIAERNAVSIDGLAAIDPAPAP
jgi:hypothetical protein